MPAYMTDDPEESKVRRAKVHRDYPSLYAKSCDCAGPQPSAGRTRADEHARECPYRVAVEADEASPARGQADELR